MAQWEDRWVRPWVADIKDGVDRQIKEVTDMDPKVDIKDGAHKDNGEVMEGVQEPVMVMVMHCHLLALLECIFQSEIECHSFSRIALSLT